VIEATQSKIAALWTDRGMESKANVNFLKRKNISNGICLKSPAELQESKNPKNALRSRKIKLGVPACQSLKNKTQKISILGQALYTEANISEAFYP
jgi:hypothetical protein